MNIRTIALAAAAFLLLPGGAAAQRPKPTPPDAGAESPSEEINVAVGETYTLPARNVRNWTEGVPGVVEVKVTSDGAQFLVAGRRPGTTTLLLLRDDGSQQAYAVNVFARSPVAVERELRQWLEGSTDLRVQRIGSRNVIEGTVADEAEKARIDHIASLYPGQVESTVTVGAPRPRAAPDGTVPAARFLVRIDFYFVEMDASTGYTVGLGWPASFGGTAFTGAGTLDLLAGHVTQATLTVNQPLPQLDLVQAKGWGKVLKHATVITNSGESAKFRSGGVQNFSVNTGLTIGLQTIPFGVEVDVVPRFDPVRGDVSLKIVSDVSDLTAPGPGTQIPSKNESKLETVVNVNLGQSLVLSGVRLSRQTHTVTGIPILSDIPVLGLLFGSHANATEESEGAIYIMPSVLENVSSSSMDLIDAAVRSFRDFGGAVGKTPIYASRPPSAH